MYRKEVEQNQIRLEKLRADGAEEWDVKNAVRLSPSFLPFHRPLGSPHNLPITPIHLSPTTSPSFELC